MKIRNQVRIKILAALMLIVIVLIAGELPAAETISAPGSKLPPASANIEITQANVTVERVGTSIPASAIGEPVSSVKLSPPQWVAGTDAASSYAVVEGAIMPVDPCGFPINFRVVLPASWSRRAIQRGGGGMNGSITVQAGGGMGGRGGSSNQGIAMYGSDSGHQAGGMGMGGMGGTGGRGGAPGAAPGAAGRGDANAAGRGGMGGRGMGGMGGAPGAAPGAAGRGDAAAGRGGMDGRGMGGAPGAAPGAAGRGDAAAGRGGMGGMDMMGAGRGGPGAAPAGGRNAGDAWALNDEAIKNLGYMQLKKTHDAAMVIMERVYGEKPRFNYFIGGSQGGREALTVAQRYPADYDGIIADVPIVNFSSLMLAPELIRIQEKPLANWVTPAKANAIRAEFMRQCDKLDGLADGIINNYMAARKLFDVTDGIGTTDPWAALRAPNNVDPNPQDTSTSAKLTSGQIKTLELTYSRYKFATPLANGVTTFGMWLPDSDVSGGGIITNTRYRGQEGAAENAPMHSHLGILGVTGFLMQNLSANPLDYVEGGPLNKRREQISQWLDSTNPDLSAFYKRGGKIMVTVGTNDTTASPGAQVDYFQSVIDKMGQDTVDAFARFYVIPQAGHGLSGSSANINGDGQTVQSIQIPNQYDKQNLLMKWVEANQAPDKTLVVTSGNRSLPLCSYPNYPKYVSGPVESASSYVSAAP